MQIDLNLFAINFEIWVDDEWALIPAMSKGN